MSTVPGVSGQQATPAQPAGRMAFDVASVRPNRSGSSSVSMRRLGGGLEAVNVTPRDLIFAFDVPRFALHRAAGTARAAARTVTRTGPGVRDRSDRTADRELKSA